MPRAPDPNKEKAKELFDKGYSLIEIANQLSVPEGTIRSWKNRYKWDNCNATQKSATLQQTQIVKSVTSNSELTDKQKLFCLYFAKSLNATQSYKKAYGCNYNSAMASGSELLRNPKIKAEVDRLKEERYLKAFLRTEDIFQKYMDIAFADITDYMDFGMDKQRDEETGQEYSFNYAHFKSSDEIDGSVVAEVAFSSKGGAKIKLHDKVKALEWLSEHMNMATEEQKLRIQMLKTKVEQPNDNDTDDGFISALEGKVSDVWEE